jgi:hypothetical protein
MSLNTWWNGRCQFNKQLDGNRIVVSGCEEILWKRWWEGAKARERFLL